MQFLSLSFPLFIVLIIAARIARSIPAPDEVIPSFGQAIPAPGAASAERNHSVQVGLHGRFVFSPDTLSTKAGDSVLFAISDPTSHTVSQSMGLDHPCTVVDSGFRSSRGNATFSIQVNDTSPIFVHCEQHCSQGMVMIINPDSALDVVEMEIVARSLNRTAPQPGGEGSSTDSPKKTVSPGEARTPSIATGSNTSVAQTRGGSLQASPAQGGSPTGRPREGMRRDVAAAVATALALGATAIAGAYYMWRRRRKQSTGAVEHDDGEPALMPFVSQQSDAYPPERKRIIMAADPKEDNGPGEERNIEPLEQQAAISRPHGPLGSGDGNPMFAAGSPGDGENAIGHGQVAVEPTSSVTFLRAELDRVLAENERLRQTAEPPAYSDGARSELEA